MKRFFFIVIPILTAFVFFSFLSQKDIQNDNKIVVFFDENLNHRSLIKHDIANKIKQSGIKISTGYFNPEEIDHFIISNPEALYITENQMHSHIFSLKKFGYLSVMVAVTSTSNELCAISSEEFSKVLKHDAVSDIETLKKIEKNKVPFGIISFINLTLNVKPLRVNGTFPTLENIKSGEYENVYRAYIYMKDNRILDKNLSLQNELGSWIKKSFSIIAGGDIMLGRGSKRYIDLYGSEYPFYDIRKEIIKHDIAFANLESPISNKGKKFFPDKGIYFRADPVVIGGLVFAGFDIFSLANNHALDWGIDAITDTMNYLEKYGLQYTGVGSTRQEALKPAVFNVGGTNVAFICYNDIYPLALKESGKTIRTLSLNGADLNREIKPLKEKYDIIIASVHSGKEYIVKPEIEKINKMRELIDSGVDVVLGSHPHVVQGVEVYKGGLIAYSLGNLIFDQNWAKETRMGLLLEISFLGERPVYYIPRVVSIDKSQAKIIENNDSEYILSYVNFNKGIPDYDKN